MEKIIIKNEILSNYYDRELSSLKEVENRIIETQNLIDRFPVLEQNLPKYINRNSLFYINENYQCFGDKLNGVYLGQDFYRNHYSSKDEKSNKFSNANKLQYEGLYFKVYINTYSMFGDVSDILYLFVQEKLKSLGVNVYHIDSLNSTYYVSNELFNDFAEELKEWYIQTKKELDSYKKEIEIKELEDRLNKLIIKE